MILNHTCKIDKENLCASCELIDLSILVMNFFNKRPDYFGNEHGQKLIIKALQIKYAVQDSVGVIRTHG